MKIRNPFRWARGRRREAQCLAAATAGPGKSTLLLRTTEQFCREHPGARLTVYDAKAPGLAAFAAAAIRTKTVAARQQLADTDAMLASRADQRS